ncbi:MAG: sigma-54 dependent transcriptional regulator [Verrucomicrobiae bacterium]|nr:sigma-54 dependent transcriptional regulator [Verrucomicrobiae bacterium]NNJ43598.1 sigma-54-dependent Fis family transcriptional regulator [Akkermansiaceae bacterium]
MPEQPPYNLILADDDRTIRNLLSLQATHHGFTPVTAKNGTEAIALIQDSVDVILLDLHMPEMDGFDCLHYLTKNHPHIPVVVLSGETDAAAAMKAVKLGALDYLTKPFDLDELFTTLRNAKKLSRVQRENQSLKDSISPSSATTDVIAHSEQMTRILNQAKKVAQLDSSVLLTGESGTGKGVLARYIHSQSPRADMPFITVSCPALPRELLESELFGHEKGAFTGALKKRIGKIEAAKGGTLFLDEIGDLPIDLQPKLLNVLQDRVFQRVGGEQSIPCDIRIITATHIDFDEKIRSKDFREDLYYRISVIPLELPALRERPEEILPLAKHFLDRVSNQREQPLTKIDPSAAEKLMQYHWPGNVRQLENLIERASAFCENNTITADDLIGKINQTPTNETSITGLAGQPLAEIEKCAIQQTLTLYGGNKAKSARKLGITEKSIYNKMKRHGLMP